MISFFYRLFIGFLTVVALLKNEQDVTLFEKLVFMQRNNR